MKRHLDFFNTHPYMAPLVLGIASKIELDRRGAGESDVVEAKKALYGPLAALGDTFFWSTLKPLCSVVAVIAAAMGSILAPVLFLVFYNVFHIWFRVRGFYEGIHRGMRAIDFIERIRLSAISERLKGVIPVLLGLFLSGILLFRPSEVSWEKHEIPGALVIVPVLLLTYLSKKHVPIILQVYGFAFLVLIGCIVLG